MKCTRVVSKRENQPQLIMSNGSERSDYIPLNHIFNQTGDLHDGYQLMKTYYPHDKQWNPKHRISEVTEIDNVGYAWDYEYEDYHPFDIFETESVTRKQMEEIKTHGADIHLTLTIDITLSDNEIRDIVRVLAQYGRMYVRINHEVNGFWFRYNKMHTPKEVSDFFVRFHKMMQAESSQLFSVFNVSGDIFMGDKKVTKDKLYFEDDQFGESLRVADFWSIDKYTSLHYAWPFEEKIKEGTFDGYFVGSVDEWWRIIEETYLQMIWHNGGQAKKVFISEFNSDSDVDGFDGQARIVSEVYDRLATCDYQWIAGIVMYTFRDYGGLGLEKGTIDSFTETPALSAYRNELPKFREPFIKDSSEWKHMEFSFTWSHSGEKKGVCISELPKESEFINSFEVPIFVFRKWKTELNACEGSWIHLGVNEVLSLNEVRSISLFIPPVTTLERGVITQVRIPNLKETCETMFLQQEVLV